MRYAHGFRRVASTPRDSAAVILWTWTASHKLRRALRAHGVDALESVVPAPDVGHDHRPTVVAALRVSAASCLVRSAVLQRWDADHGRARTLVIGVARDGDDVAAHAWLEGERRTGSFVELHRRAAP